MTPSISPTCSNARLFLMPLVLVAFLLLFAGSASPASAAIPAGGCATGQYTSDFYNNDFLGGSPVLSRCDATVNFDWSGGSPDPAINNDYFSARFTAQRDFVAGNYTFNVVVDDGFRLFIDGTLAMQAWYQQPPTYYGITRTMTAGSHTIMIEYVEVAGGAVMKFWVTPPSNTIELSAPTYAVGEAAGSATITATRSGDVGNTQTVDYTTSDGTATAGSDYTATSGTATFQPGDATTTFTVPITSDTLHEGDETVNLALSNPADNASLGAQSSAQLTIQDDDPVPTLSVSDVSGNEGNVAPGLLTFTVALSNPTTVDVAGGYASVDGTASSLSDYTPVNGSFIIPAGSSSTTVSVFTQGDVVFEADETFLLNVTGITNANVVGSDLSGTGTILNDDLPTVDLSVTKADSADPAALGGSLTYTITVRNLTPDHPASGVTITDQLPATVTYVASSGDCGYNAVSGVATCGTIAAGGSKTLSIVVTPNSATTLSNAATVATANPEDLLANNSTTETTVVDSPGTFHFVTSAEWVGEGAGSASITVIRSGGAGGTATVDYTTTPGSATAGSDYTAVSGTLTFAPGETSKTFDVPVLNDTLDEESAKDLTLTLSNPTGAAFDASDPSPTETLTIIDNDPLPVVSAADVTQNEGDSGTSPMTFTVSLSAASERTVTVHYYTGIDGAAQAPGDFTATSGTLTFAPGETAKTVTIQIVGDTVVEPNERLFLQLDDSVNATQNESGATGMILNDDTDFADLSLTKLAPVTSQVGSRFDYTLVVSNSGPRASTLTALQDALPPQVVLLSSTTTQGSCVGTDTVSCDLGSLASGATATVTLRVKAVLIGTATNQASVSSAETDPVPANNTAQATTAIAAAPVMPPVALPTPPTPTETATPLVTPPTPPTPVSPCQITLTSSYIFRGLITYVGVRVTRDDIPVAGINVYSKHSWTSRITKTRTNAFGYVEYHFLAVSPGTSIEVVADCDGGGLQPLSLRNLKAPGRSRSLAQEPAALITSSLLTTPRLAKVGAYIGQGQRTPASRTNCNTVSVSSSRLRAGKRGSVAVDVRFADQPVKAAAVVISGAGIHRVKATGPSGKVTFTVRPRRPGILYVRVWNFASCSYVENLPVAAR